MAKDVKTELTDVIADAREDDHLSAVDRLLVGDYPWYTEPIVPSNNSGKKPRTYHLVVDLAYSSVFGKIASWYSMLDETTSKCAVTNSVVGCTLAAFFLCATLLFHWWRLNLNLIWYDNRQSILSDIFLVGDNICMLGISTVLFQSQSADSPNDDYRVNDMLGLLLIADGLIYVQQGIGYYFNRHHPEALWTLQMYVAHTCAGFVLRLVYYILNDTIKLRELNSGNTMFNQANSWDWIVYGTVLDVASPWLWLVYKIMKKRYGYRWVKAFLLDIPFVDARVGRIMTIVVALILGAGVLPNWETMGQTCHARVLIYPSVLVFSYLPYMVTFDRDPGTSNNEHAIRQAEWSTILYFQFAVVIPTLTILLAGKLQRVMTDGCGDNAANTESQHEWSQWAFVVIHASLVCCSALRCLLHTQNPKYTCRWSRRTSTNLFCFFFERYGRVTKQQLAEHQVQEKSAKPKLEAQTKLAPTYLVTSNPPADLVKPDAELASVVQNPLQNRDGETVTV